MLQHSLLYLGELLHPGELCWVAGAQGLIVFAHADGGGNTARHAQVVLSRLQSRGFSTLDFDLLSAHEAAVPETLEDVGLLTQRLAQAIARLPAAERQVPLGLYGFDTGSAAALMLAVERPQAVQALVSRSGRVELVSDVLGDVRTPTLLMAGAADPPMVEINRQAYARLRCDKRIDIVPRATHHFLEAGTLDVAAQLAADWFGQHLRLPAQ